MVLTGPAPMTSVSTSCTPSPFPALTFALTISVDILNSIYNYLESVDTVVIVVVMKQIITWTVYSQPALTTIFHIPEIIG